jgi:hypothetical protein
MNPLHTVLSNSFNVHFSNILTLFSHVRLGLPNGCPFTWGLLSKTPYKFLFSTFACHMTSLSHVTSLHQPYSRYPVCCTNHEFSHHAIFSTLLLNPPLLHPDTLISTQFSKTLLSFVLRINNQVSHPYTKTHTNTTIHILLHSRFPAQ